MASARIFTAYRPTRREVYLEKSGHVIEKGSPDLRNKANCPLCAADSGTGVHRQPASHRSKDPTAQRPSPTSREQGTVPAQYRCLRSFLPDSWLVQDGGS